MLEAIATSLSGNNGLRYLSIVIPIPIKNIGKISGTGSSYGRYSAIRFI